MKTKEKGSTLLGFAVGLALAALVIAGCKTNVSSTPETFAVTFSVDGGNGKLKAKADCITETTESPITVEKGKTVTFTATADSGYRVKGWTRDGEAVNGTNASYSFTVTKGVEVKVSFESNSTPPTPPASTDKTYTVGGISFTMKGIAAVTNKNVGHADYSSNNDVHTVSLTAYRIGETEVTQELWKKVMGNNPSSFSSSPESGEVQEKRPVERVSWYDCIAFCNELTKQAGLGESQCVYSVEGHIYGTADAVAKKVPEMDMNKKGFRLPTEAEWEWAAMGGKDYKWSGTNVESELGTYAWYDANSSGTTHEVKKKLANGYGLYDMSGNVGEWCWDRYSNSTPEGGKDPRGADSGSIRVRRGGSWIVNAVFAARACRDILDPDLCHFNLGLRLISRP
jgi:transcriptional regulator (fragment)